MNRAGFLVAAIGLGMLPAAAAHANEVMTDRCSAEVAFVPRYDDKPTAEGTIILKRGADGSTPWTSVFKRGLDGDGRVRWWCHSTTGDWLDPGTWRVHADAGGIVACLTAAGSTIATEGAAAASLAGCVKVVKISSSAFDGWTAERSRCSNHSDKFRARLGPDRLLQTECEGK